MQGYSPIQPMYLSHWRWAPQTRCHTHGTELAAMHTGRENSEDWQLLFCHGTSGSDCSGQLDWCLFHHRIKRCRLVRKDFKFSSYDTTRICSEHFVGGKGPTKEHNIPSIFPSRTFTISCVSNSVDASTQPMDVEHEERDMYMYEQDDQTNLYVVDNQCGQGISANEFISLSMHDYVGVSNFNGGTFLNKKIQTDPKLLMDASTQTDVDTVTKVKYASTQVSPSTSDFSCQTNLPSLVFEDIKDSDEKIMFYTGIPNYGTFHVLFDEISCKLYSEEETEKDKKGGRPRCLRLVDEFFLVLMRFRLGLLIEDLCDRFYVSKTTCANIINHWIDFLSINLSFLISWPDCVTNSRTMPSQFKSKYPRCRAIVDCTEFYTETPNSLANRSLMFSHYKSHMTWKALLAVNPRGVITFVSDLWGGSVSDKQIFINSGMLELLDKGDQLMVDKGFQISDLTTPRGIELIIPPFKRQGEFSRREVEETRRIANLRIHVERANERVKNFRILQGNIPITLSKSVSNIFKICAALSNLQPPLVNN